MICGKFKKLIEHDASPEFIFNVGLSSLNLFYKMVFIEMLMILGALAYVILSRF